MKQLTRQRTTILFDSRSRQVIQDERMSSKSSPLLQVVERWRGYTCFKCGPQADVATSFGQASSSVAMASEQSGGGYPDEGGQIVGL